MTISCCDQMSYLLLCDQMSCDQMSCDQMFCDQMSCDQMSCDQMSGYRFIAAKAAQQVFTTEALVSYERAVTTKVLRGSIPDWMASDAESVSLYLGVEGTFALRNVMANPRIPRSSKSSWDDWPDTVCWLYNYRQCESAKCRRRHVCGFCRSKDHKAKDCTLPKSSSASVHNKADYPEVRKNSE